MTGIRATLVQAPNGVVDDLGIRATVESQSIAVGPVSAGILGNRSNTTNLSLTRVALSGIQRYQAVVEVGDQGVQAPNGITSSTALLGLTTNVAAAGETLDVMIIGEIHDPTWQWSTGSVFVGPTGVLTQLNTGSNCRRVAVAISATSIFIDMRDGAQSQNTILSGGGPPVASLGNQGDFYIDLTNYDIWGPKADTWLTKGSLIGPQGPQGVIVSNVYPFTPTTHMILPHNLGHYPGVIVKDSTGEEVWADVHYLDINTLEISFAFPMGGTVILT